MRVAYNDFGLIWSDSEFPEIIGIKLGYDFTAEHEHGTKPLAKLLEINGFDPTVAKPKKSHIGVNARTINSVDNVYIGDFEIDSHHYYYLYVGDIFYGDGPDKKKIEARIKSQMAVNLEQMIEASSVATAWSDSDICFVCKIPNLPKYFLDNMKKKNVFFGRLVHSGAASFSMVLISKIPDETADMMMKDDMSIIELNKIDESIGIREALKKKDRDWSLAHPNAMTSPWGFMALSPRLIKDSKKEKYDTKHPLIYWLNPRNQELISAGWYTVEDLETWLNGEPGKIVSADDWPRLLWLSRSIKLSMLNFQYKQFPDIEPVYHWQRGSMKRIVKGTPKSRDHDYKIIMEHALALYVSDFRDRVKYLDEDIESISHPRTGASDRVFGFLEAMSLLGFGEWGAINTPTARENFAWLNDVLEIQAWTIVAKENAYITQEEIDKFVRNKDED